MTFVSGISLAGCLYAQSPAVNRQSPIEGTVSAASFAAASLNDPQARTSLEMIAPQAEAHVTYALNLAERGAIHSAQAEFIMALDLIADALDADTKNATREHARAVKAGLTAIEETKDFVPADTPHDIEIDLSQLASNHQTPVLKNVDTARLTRAQALQQYHLYATQQLAFAGGQSAIASSALYGLGRAESIATPGAGARNPLGGPNAMALYQAALLVNPQNYMASNELGVLMARFGDLDAAEGQLKHSLSIKPQIETWHNLAVVYRRKGQLEKAEQADREREKLIAAARNKGAATKESTDAASRPVMRWVDVDTFASSGTPYGLDGPAINSSTSGKAAPTAHEWPGKRLVSKLIPWPKSQKPEQTNEIMQLSQKPDALHDGGADGRLLLK